MLNAIDIIGGSIVLVISAIIFAYILITPSKFKITIEKVIITILGIIIYSLIAKYTEGIVKTLCLFCLYLILFKSILKTTYSDALFLDFLYSVLILIPDILIIILISIWESAQIFYTEYAGTIIPTLIVNGLLIVITCIFRKKLKNLFNIKVNNNKVILIYTILTFISILLIFYDSFGNIKIDGNLIISVIIMLVFVIILYSLIRQKLENTKVIEKYDKLLEFIKKYEVIIEEQRELRHESKNQLITVKSKVLNRDEEKAIIEYVDSILNDHKSYKEDKYAKFQYLPANGLKGLFYYKTMEAEEKGIKLSINIGKRVEESVLSKLTTEDFKQLGRLVGVYLDNAIEASNESKQKKLGIEIYLQEEDVIMIITNTYSGEIDKESIGKVKYTTKGKNHGYGLMLVNKILTGSNRFIAERKITDTLYIQKLIIKNY